MHHCWLLFFLVLFAVDSKGVGEAIGGAICAVVSLILILTVLAIGCAVIYHLAQLLT